MNKKFKGHYSFLSDTGSVRLNNDDDCLVCCNSNGDVLMIVADGMGGHQRGDYASKNAVSFIKDEFECKSKFLNSLDVYLFLIKSLSRINRQLYDIAHTNSSYKGMGTTIVIGLIYNDKLFVLNVGDSRLYRLKNNELSLLTKDDSYVNYLFNTGNIKYDEMKTHPQRHVLTNALGLFKHVRFDLKKYKYNGESILLCSDGLYNNAQNKDIENIIKTNDLVDQKVKSLVNLANFNGGSDNISVALWESMDVN